MGLYRGPPRWAVLQTWRYNLHPEQGMITRTKCVFLMHCKTKISSNPTVMLKFEVGVCSLQVSDHLKWVISGPSEELGTIEVLYWQRLPHHLDGKRQTGLGSFFGSLMRISCVTTETVLVLLAEAELSWQTAPFHHFHLDCFSTLSLLPCQAVSSPQPTHLLGISLTSPNRNVCSQETQA